jgi:hypothetical protein
MLFSLMVQSAKLWVQGLYCGYVLTVVPPGPKPSRATRLRSIRESRLRNSNPGYASPTICLVVSGLISSQTRVPAHTSQSYQW